MNLVRHYIHPNPAGGRYPIRERYQHTRPGPQVLPDNP